MNQNAIRAIDAIHADRAARFAAEARAARLAPRASRAADRRIRRAIGRSIVAIGARIAADPAVELCVRAANRGSGRPATFDGVPTP